MGSNTPTAATSFTTNQTQYFILFGLHSPRRGSRLRPEDIPNEKHHICGSLRETPHKIRIPRLSIWHIQPQPIALCNDTPLQVPPNPIKHLKFKAIRRNTPVFYGPQGFDNDLFIVRGECWKRSALQHLMH